MTDPIQKHPFIAWFASNPVVANIMMLAILIWGGVTALTIRKEAFPSFAPDSINVTVRFNGGVPEEVERGVVIKIEEALQGVDGIAHLRSTSSDTGATVVVEALEDYSLTKLFNEVKVQVDSISTFPEQAERPIVSENASQSNVIKIDVHGQVSPRELKETARLVKDELLKLPDINQVQTEGARDYELSVEISEEKLRLYDLTFGEVARAVSANSVDLAGGFVRSDRGDISLRTRSQVYDAGDLARIPLRTEPDGVRVLLGDIAEIRDQFVDQLVLNRFDGQPSVSLQVTTEGDRDIVKASAQAADLAARYATDFGLPEGVSLTAWNDGADPIRSRLQLLMKNGAQGILLVLITLSLFLNIRLAAWVALGIPVSIAGAFILFEIPGFDFSLNMITAFSFIVVLGLIVDDAIVLGESIYSEKQARGRSESTSESLRSTVRGVARVITPATFGVLTTIAAFFPLTQVAGGMGNVLGQIAFGVIFCLIFSLIESKLILPAHLCHVDVHREPRNPISKGWAHVQGAVVAALDFFITRLFQPLLAKAVQLRYLTLAAFVAILILVVALLPSGHLRFVFFPSIFTDDVTATLELEEGLSVSELHHQALRIATAISSVHDDLATEIAEKAVLHIQVSAETNTTAVVSASLTTSESRSTDTGEIVKRWREKVGSISGAKGLTFSGTAGAPGRELSIQLESKDLEALQAAAEELQGVLATYPGVFNPKDSFRSGRTEIQVALNPVGEASGFSRRDLAEAVRSAFYGIEAQRVQRGRDEVKVMVRYPEKDRAQLETLRQMRVRSDDGSAVPFSIVAETEFNQSLAAIERADSNRVVTVTAEIDKTITSGDEVIAQLEAEFFPLMKAKHPNVNVALRGEAEERSRSIRSLQKGLGLSVLLIYILLAIPLKSYTKPLFIMSVIPFGIIGALLGHYIIGIPVSILSLFGVLALSGIVVNDSLVLSARIDDLRAEGLPLREAILRAGPQRFRAIFLTTLTTFIGLCPILIETSTQAQFLKPMAVSVGFGVVFATAITLILLPILMIISDETLGASFRYYRAKLKPEKVPK